MSLRIYVERPVADARTGSETGVLELGAPLTTSPACDECRRPSAVELAGRSYCAPCLEELVERGRQPERRR